MANQQTALMTLDEKEVNFAALLAEGVRTSEAGEQVGISPATAFRWAKNPVVLDQVARFQNEVRNRVIRRLFGLAEKALDLHERALDGEGVTNAQVKSADSVLDRIGASRESIIKHIGSTDEPIVVTNRVPVNVDAVDEQAERHRRRLERQEKAIEGDFRVVSERQDP